MDSIWSAMQVVLGTGGECTWWHLTKRHSWPYCWAMFESRPTWNEYFNVIAVFMSYHLGSKYAGGFKSSDDTFPGGDLLPDREGVCQVPYWFPDHTFTSEHVFLCFVCDVFGGRYQFMFFKGQL